MSKVETILHEHHLFVALGSFCLSYHFFADAAFVPLLHVVISKCGHVLLHLLIPGKIDIWLHK